MVAFYVSFDLIPYMPYIG